MSGILQESNEPHTGGLKASQCLGAAMVDLVRRIEKCLSGKMKEYSEQTSHQKKKRL